MDWARIKKHQSLLGSPSEGGELRMVISEKPSSARSLLVYFGVTAKPGRWGRPSRKANQDKTNSGIRLLFQLRNTLKARKGLVYEPFVFDFRIMSEVHQ